MSKVKLATIWLDGCSGCHMSFLDMDERLIGVLEVADLVYSPLVDAKEFPTDVDITLVEGAVSTTDDLKKLKKHANTQSSWSRLGTALSPATFLLCATRSAALRCWKPCT
jgi:coenzyme F420-reducing hydrogenase gamma subunit